MKHLNRNRFLFLAPTVVLGLGSLWLHGYMMDTCFDDKGLLVSWNAPSIALIVMGGAFGLYLLLLTRSLGGSGTYHEAFPRCILSGALVLAGAVELALFLLSQGFANQVEMVLCLAAVGSMAVTGLLRMFGKRPWFIFNGVVCLFFMYRMLMNYRGWSADPQLQDYAYQMIACCFLMLAAFQRTCCDAGIIDRKRLVFTALVAAFCCLASMGDDNAIFYLACGLWAAGSLCSLAQFPEDAGEPPAEPEVPQEPKEDIDDLLESAKKLMEDA